ncbi:MAG: terminase small subunit [Hyphomicrobium sp.]|nr:terminase small subunit [Hyphomicrobium sp.]
MAKKRKPRVGEKLTALQERFCQSYALSDNGAASYAAAYPKSRKWTPQSRAVKASQLLATDKIQKRLDELRVLVADKAEKAFDLSVERILQEMAAIGFSNMGDYLHITAGGDPAVALADLSRQQMAAISEVVVEDFVEGRGDDARDVRRVRFKLHDKRAALKDLGQHFGAFKIPIEGELGGKGGGPISIMITDADAAL